MHNRLRARLGLVVLAVLFALPAAAQQRAMVPVTLDGETVRLATITYTPAGNGPFPILILHHGSTGRGTDPSLFARPYEPTPLIRWFVARGWAVVLPSRRGRGGSEGRYDEGFEIDRRQGYSCQPELALPGAERAVRDIDAVTDAVLAQPFADRSRFAVGGPACPRPRSTSWAAGAASAARPPARSTARCSRAGTFGKPTLWLYGDNDSFYPLVHSRSNFAAFQAAGGQGSFHDYVPPNGVNGHGIGLLPELWGGAMAAYLAERGLPAK